MCVCAVTAGGRAFTYVLERVMGRGIRFARACVCGVTGRGRGARRRRCGSGSDVCGVTGRGRGLRWRR